MQPSILFDARLVLEKPTGIGRYIASLLPELVRLAPDIHFHLLTRPNFWAGYQFIPSNAPNLTHHLSSLPHMSLQQQWEIPHLARRLGVNLVHYPHFDAPVWLGTVPVVSTIYDVKYLVKPDFFPHLSRVKRLYMRFCFVQTLRRAKAIITVSDATALDLQRLFSPDQSRIYPIHLAMDVGFKPASPQQIDHLRQNYGLPRPFILSVGERRPHKNFVGLIQAYAQSNSRHSHDLVIVGQSYQDYTEPEHVAHQLKLTNQVHFFTGVNFDDLVAFYTAADLFVLISFYEGFGLPILEAMVCGTPVIASNTTATGEITGEGGIQVDPQNIPQISQTIDRVLQDTKFQREQIARGYKWQQTFSWQQNAKQTLAVYQKILNNQKPLLSAK